MELLYEVLANSIEKLITNGVYSPGSRLPSIRQISRERTVSVSTVTRAYVELERRGRVQAYTRSGFYVRAPLPALPLPRVREISSQPIPVTGTDRIMRLLAAANDPDVMDFGSASPHPDFMPGAALEKSFRSVWRESRRACLTQIFPPGSLALRRQIARRLAAARCMISPENVVITNGCQESIAIALRLATEPGDIVAVESPTYYGLLEVIEQLGLRALEIPADPAHGLSIEALACQLEQWPIKACIVVPNISNPLGYCMSDERKQQLLSLAQTYGIALIEDDVYGEFPVHGRRPRPIKSWDERGTVFYCGSATKTIASGLRIGWLVVNESHMTSARYQQYVRTIAVQTAGQLALADYLRRGQVDRNIGQMSNAYARTRAHLVERIETLFPTGTRLSRPAGGFVIWLELPEAINTTEVADDALRAGISFAPGQLFSAGGRFTHCIRLNSAQRWDGVTERALAKLAALLDQ